MTVKTQKNTNSASEMALEKAKEQIDMFEDSVKELTLDQMNKAPKQESDPQVKESQRELQQKEGHYLKPTRIISSSQKFNERFRDEYEFRKQYVQFVAENHEIIGESIIKWTRPYGGMAAEEWTIPVNKPVWGPRYLAEELKGCSYHRLTMKDTTIGSDNNGTYYGQMVADTTVNRLDARPVSSAKSVFI